MLLTVGIVASTFFWMWSIWFMLVEVPMESKMLCEFQVNISVHFFYCSTQSEACVLSIFFHFNSNAIFSPIHSLTHQWAENDGNIYVFTSIVSWMETGSTLSSSRFIDSDIQCSAPHLFLFAHPMEDNSNNKKRHRIFSSQFTGSWCTRLHWVNMQIDGKKWKIEMKSNVNSRIEREKKHTQSLLECNGKIVFSLFLLIFTLNTEKKGADNQRKMLSNNRFEAMHFRAV